ncbi:MAG: hypothetical protein ACF8Q5_13490, partial [Phycisphaerales bacterium JB040]
MIATKPDALDHETLLLDLVSSEGGLLTIAGRHGLTLAELLDIARTPRFRDQLHALADLARIRESAIAAQAR